MHLENGMKLNRESICLGFCVLTWVPESEMLSRSSSSFSGDCCTRPCKLGWHYHSHSSLKKVAGLTSNSRFQTALTSHTGLTTGSCLPPSMRLFVPSVPFPLMSALTPSNSSSSSMPGYSVDTESTVPLPLVLSSPSQASSSFWQDPSWLLRKSLSQSHYPALNKIMKTPVYLLWDKWNCGAELSTCKSSTRDIWAFFKSPRRLSMFSVFFW